MGYMNPSAVFAAFTSCCALGASGDACPLASASSKRKSRSMKKLQLMILPVVLATLACLASAVPASAAPGFGRHYELATPPDKLGQPTRLEAISPDGLSVRFATVGGNGLPGTESQDPYQNGYLARRIGNRWEYLPMNPPLPHGGPPNMSDTTVTLDRYLSLNVTDGPTDAMAFFVRRAGEAAVKVSPDIVNRTAPDQTARPAYQGASADLSHILFIAQASGPFEAEHAYLASDPPPESFLQSSPEKLYESVAGAPSIRRVDVDNSGTPISDCAGVKLGWVRRRHNAISADGRRIFFSARPDCLPFIDPGRQRLYARVDGSSTVELSASECDRAADPSSTPPVTACAAISGDAQFVEAAADGRRAFFMSTDQLVDGDTDGTSDLYMYDFDAPPGARLSQVSSGDQTDASPGAGADVAGVVRGSDDGSRIAFVARGVLTTGANSEGAVAAAGASNLYVANTVSGQTTFVGTLGADDTLVFDNDNGQAGGAQLADPAGRYLVFTAAARLTSDDTDSARDVYLFDAGTAKLTRVSKAGAGYGSNGNAETDATIVGPNYAVAAFVQGPSIGRSATTDGSRVIFTTAEALEADDTNGGLDVYEWHNGQVGLVSDGVDPDSTVTLGTYAAPRISADGSAVAFTTYRRLDPDRDTDQASDVYVARLGPDVDPVAPSPPPPCSGDACQGPTVGDRPDPVVSTLTFQGTGNIPAPPAEQQGSVTVSKVKAVVGSRAALKIKVPASGRLSVSGNGVKATKKTIARGGTYTVAVTLSSQALKSLRKQHSVRAKVKVVFLPRTGAPSTARLTLTFRSAASKKGQSR